MLTTAHWMKPSLMLRMLALNVLQLWLDQTRQLGQSGCPQPGAIMPDADQCKGLSATNNWRDLWLNFNT